MCGIAGVLNLREAPPTDLQTLRRMIGAMQHRGPDEFGAYLDDNISLAHARLSIIGLAGGTQPIHNEDSTLWIVYNGEIFNYPELRKRLESQGHRFYTNTDTEVIVHLFEEKGPDCLHDLNGQFAFALWDSKRRELFIARDRVGIRPLHYTLYDNNLIFASEIKSIFSVEGVPRTLDPMALNQVFTFWTTLPGKTAFEGINELPPGHFMRVSDGHVQIERYWDIPFHPEDEHFNKSESEIAEEVRELLTDATRIRLRADVPVGCYLSGGLDSSGISSLVANRFNNEVNTFGIRFEEKAYDEGEHQLFMASHLNVAHREYLANNDIIGASLPEVVWHCEKPLLRTSPIPLFLLSGLVRESDYKVVLTGEGADEVFAGYNIFQEALMRKTWASQPDPEKRAADVGRLYPYIFNDPKMKYMLESFFSQGVEHVDDPFFSHLVRWRNTGRNRTFLADDIRQASDADLGRDDLLNSFPASYSKMDTLSRAQYLEMAVFMSNYLLSSQGDRVAMAHSVEIRVPFLDHRLIEYMSRVPLQMKIKDGEEKYILREAFKGILPERIRKRQKHPYRAPIHGSILHSGLDYWQDALSESTLRQTGIFNPKKVEKLLAKIERSNRPGETDEMAVAGILSTQLLHQQYISGFPCFAPSQIEFDMIVDKRSRAGREVN
jgi:asparagine synthase (glutamine-hydrolysing)